MPYHDSTNTEEEISKEKDIVSSETVSKILWILVPVLIGGIISIFSNFQLEVQFVMWGVLAVIVFFGLWANNAKRIRKRRESVDKQHWAKLMDGLDEQFEKVTASFAHVNERFDEVDDKFDRIDRANATLLRSELISAHRAWVERKGYITLEALEYVDETYAEYKATGANGSGTRIWEDLHNLPIIEE